jgi:hypothetical protein
MGELTNGRTLLAILSLVLSPLLGAVIGYGAFKYTSGVQEQKLANVESKIAELQKQIEHDGDKYVSRSELKDRLDAWTHTLDSIQADVRAMRYGNR